MINIPYLSPSLQASSVTPHTTIASASFPTTKHSHPLHASDTQGCKEHVCVCALMRIGLVGKCVCVREREREKEFVCVCAHNNMVVKKPCHKGSGVMLIVCLWLLSLCLLSLQGGSLLSLSSYSGRNAINLTIKTSGSRR